MIYGGETWFHRPSNRNDFMPTEFQPILMAALACSESADSEAVNIIAVNQQLPGDTWWLQNSCDLNCAIAYPESYELDLDCGWNVIHLSVMLTVR